MSTKQRFLLVRFSSLGDIVLTTPLVRVLKREFPEAEITFVTRDVYAPLVEHNPAIGSVVRLSPGESVAKLAARLAGTAYDLALDLHGSLRSFALRRLLGGRWKGYDKRRVHRALLVHLGVDRYADNSSVAERYFTAVKELAIEPDGEPPQVFVSATDRAVARKYAANAPIVLAPGARHATKMWPRHRWAELAALLVGSGRELLVLGQDADEAALTGLPLRSLLGAPLGQVAAIVQSASLVVANDSGLMHLATAVGTPVVALFGPTVRQFGFFPYSPTATVIERDLPCRPCSKGGSRRCPLGHHACLAEIGPELVAAAVAAAA